MGRHDKAEVNSPSCVLKFEILFLALAWKQDLTVVLLVVSKPLQGFFAP